MHERSSICFNGATAPWPWKTRRALSWGLIWSRLQWGHGPVAVEDARLGRVAVGGVHASMGPRPRGRGRRGCPVMGVGPMTVLQWGHGPVAVEDKLRPPKTHPNRTASMGPRTRGRGRQTQSWDDVAPRSGFNGATAPWPWKTCQQMF